MTIISGGVTAPKGFRAAGYHCGIRKNRTKKDLALVVSEVKAAAAAVYTQNKVKGAPILVTKKHLENNMAQAVICNSGNANTCNADGEEKANSMCEMTAKAMGIDPQDVIVASTGVIGQTLSLEPIKSGMAGLVAELSHDGGTHAAEAIMTTDTRKKELAVEVVIGGKTVTIGAMAKGSGMICPDMATMLGFITTDAAIAPELLAGLLKESADKSFNQVSVDGDTSTNDMLCILANGLAGNPVICKKNADYEAFAGALDFINIEIAKALAADGEGATKLIQCHVKKVSGLSDARKLAKTVINSPLCKTAVFGADANWGRILCALGYSGCEFDPFSVDVAFISKKGKIEVCRDGQSLPFDETIAKEILLEDDITIEIDLKQGVFEAWAWGCDLTYEYVRINGDYRT